MIYDVVVTGSMGLVGSRLVRNFKDSGLHVAGLDIESGNDLRDEEFVINWFKNNPARSLVNAFGYNDHVLTTSTKLNLEQIELKHFDHVLNINLTTLFSVCRQFVASNLSGSIINFSSIYGLVAPDPDIYESRDKDIAYGVSKAGVIQLTRHLSVHYAPNFRFNTIVLGGIKNLQSSTFVANYTNKVPLGRMANTEDLIGLVDFLISESSSYFTGSVFTMDGGFTAV